MKFRQFNFNPFQRNKNKKKNKQIIEEQHPCKDDSLDQNSNKCDIHEVKDKKDFSHVKCTDTCVLDLGWNDEPDINEYKKLNVEIGPQNLFDYYPYLGLIDSVNFNGSREHTKCSCKFITDYCNNPNIYDKHCNLFDPNELSNAGEKKNNLRTARSRIKTNPWLPTPRPIFDISPTNSLINNSRSPKCLLKTTSEVTPDFGNSVSLNVCFKDKENNQSSSDYNSLLNDESSFDRQVARQQLSLNNLNCRWSIISDGDISIDLNSSPIIEDIGNNFFNLEANINFDYENNVDLVLDSELTKRGVKTSVSINDLLEDSLVSHTAPPNSLVEYFSDDSSSCSEKMDESFSDNLFPYDDCSENEADISSADVSFIEEYCSSENLNRRDIVLHKCNNLDDSIDAGYSSLKRDGRFGSDAETEASQEKMEMPRCENCLENEKQNQIENFVPQRSFNDYQRSLPEIKSSLEEKVSILRLEKDIVQQKIREAQEEEEIRMEERKRFSSQLSVHKKQILLDTLNDLKDKLENQSLRLQKSYSAVLTMQKQFASRKASFSFITTTHMYT